MTRLKTNRRALGCIVESTPLKVFPRVFRLSARLTRLLATILGVVFGTGLVLSAHAATFNVDTTVDNAALTACDDAAPDDCSLRGAILTANARPISEASTINVPAGTYVLAQRNNCLFQTSQFGVNLIQNTTSLCLAGKITVIGAGAASVIIDGNQTAGNGVVAPVMFVGNNAPVEIRGVTIRKGNIGGGTFGGGGGINNAGTLTLVESVISGNMAQGDGGGIYNSGTLTVRRSTLDGNFSIVGDGGGIYNYSQGTLTVTDSTISNNNALSNGGGIVNFGGTVTISHSTVNNNTAQTQLGGGIANFGGNFPGALRVINTTISGNRSDSSGGGIYNHFLTATDLNNVTITANATGLSRGVGGGIANTDGGGVTLRNTLIAGNIAAVSGPDCFGFAPRNSALTSQGHNLIQNTTGCDLNGDATGNIIGQDPQLGLLADNGGLTKTHALSESSPAVDAGNPDAPGSGGSACVVSDQRGFLRPLDVFCDIGAFERSRAFSLARVLPSIGGNTGSVSAVISGNSFTKGVTVKLTRAGQPDIVGNPVQVDAGGSAIAATFNLVGKLTGLWDVVVMNPDGAAKTLAGGFTIEEGRAPELWVDVVGRFFRPGRSSKLTVLYGNRGNIDAVGAPLSLSFPVGYAPRRFFAITPPPPQPGQVREDWSQVPVHVLTDAQSGFIDVPLILPVIPAGFTGVLQIGLTLPPGAQDNLLLAALGDQVFAPDLDPEAVSFAVAGAQAYVQDNFGLTIPPFLIPDLEQYVTSQLQQVIESGRAAFVASLGTQSQVYSVAQLHFDLALFGAVRALGNSQAATNLEHWFAAAVYDVLVPSSSWFDLPEAWAQQQNCPIAPQKGEVLPPGCSGGGGPDEPFLPPEIPLPPGCDPKKPSTFKNCHLTEDHCDALPTHKVVRDKEGNPFCVPKKPPDFCPKIPIDNPFLGGSGNAQCKPFPLRPKNSIDPNDKVGTLGATPVQFLMDATALSYTINFENLETAAAAAQEVVITDQLDVNTMDLDTLSLGPISFGDITVVPAPGVQQYTGGVDLRPARNLIVTIQANLDKPTGLLTWRFTSIDPLTGQLTEDPDAGFLPPNVDPPEGDGSVVFTVEPKVGLATNTSLCNKASIVFDVNDPIVTPEWCNSIDNTPPSSAVQALSATQATPQFLVQWAGSDQGAGIVNYSIFVSENGGPFSALLTDTADTSVPFTAQPGKTYAFYSVARDAVGHEEEPPLMADTQTVIAGLDQCPDDPNKTEPGACGCGVPDANAGQSCATGQPGVCGAGTLVCDSGVASCQPIQSPTAELCDGLDNNCDGAVDEGNPGGGAACTTGLPGVCSVGTELCTNGALVCQQTTQPGAEICGNGIDEDCNGSDLSCPPPPGDTCLAPHVLDTFNRANGNVGGNWRGVTGTSFYRIASNRLDVQLGGPLYWNATTFGTDQTGVVTLSTVDSRSPSQGVLLKVQSGNVPNAGAIAVVYDGAAKTVRVSTMRLGRPAWTSYGNTTISFSDGDKLGACAKANGEVRVYKNDALVKSVMLNSADQEFFHDKGGKVGIWSFLAPRAVLDDFGGATIAP